MGSPSRSRIARLADTPVFDFGYIFCTLLGTGIFCGALMAEEPVQTTWYVLGVMALLLGGRALHYFTPREHRFSDEDNAGVADSLLPPGVRPIEEVLDN